MDWKLGGVICATMGAVIGVAAGWYAARGSGGYSECVLTGVRPSMNELAVREVTAACLMKHSKPAGERPLSGPEVEALTGTLAVEGGFGVLEVYNPHEHLLLTEVTVTVGSPDTGDAQAPDFPRAYSVKITADARSVATSRFDLLETDLPDDGKGGQRYVWSILSANGIGDG